MDDNEQVINLWPLAGTIPLSALHEETQRQIKLQNRLIQEVVAMPLAAMGNA